MIRELLLECRVVPSVGSVRDVRREVGAALTPMLPAATIRDVVLIVSELCTNAIEAAHEGSGDVVVRVEVPSSRSCTVEVEDCGAGFALDDSRPQAGQADESGRGGSASSVGLPTT